MSSIIHINFDSSGRDAVVNRRARNSTAAGAAAAQRKGHYYIIRRAGRQTGRNWGIQLTA